MALHKPEHRKWWYWASWPFLTAFFCIIFPLALTIRGYASTRKGWLRDLENWIDDPVDFVKEWWHCRHIAWGYQLNISFLMQNRKTTWDIIRKMPKPGVQYANCDPEDMEV
jgi:hypothetical protein